MWVTMPSYYEVTMPLLPYPRITRLLLQDVTALATGTTINVLCVLLLLLCFCGGLNLWLLGRLFYVLICSTWVVALIWFVLVLELISVYALMLPPVVLLRAASYCTFAWSALCSLYYIRVFFGAVVVVPLVTLLAVLVITFEFVTCVLGPASPSQFLYSVLGELQNEWTLINWEGHDRGSLGTSRANESEMLNIAGISMFPVEGEIHYKEASTSRGQYWGLNTEQRQVLWRNNEFHRSKLKQIQEVPLVIACQVANAP